MSKVLCQCYKSLKEPTLPCPHPAIKGTLYCGHHQKCQEAKIQPNVRPTPVEKKPSPKAPSPQKQSIKTKITSPIVQKKQKQQVKEQSQPTFTYEISGLDLNDHDKNVKSVTFEVCRYGSVDPDVIKFSSPVTEVDAIMAVEEYLSIPLRPEYFDLNHDIYDSFEEITHEINEEFHRDPVRGDLVNGAHFLEVIERNRGDITLICGS